MHAHATSLSILEADGRLTLGTHHEGAAAFFGVPLFGSLSARGCFAEASASNVSTSDEQELHTGRTGGALQQLL